MAFKLVQPRLKGVMVAISTEGKKNLAKLLKRTAHNCPKCGGSLTITIINNLVSDEDRNVLSKLEVQNALCLKDVEDIMMILIETGQVSDESIKKSMEKFND